jgi:hypothetical protein
MLRRPLILLLALLAGAAHAEEAPAPAADSASAEAPAEEAMAVQRPDAEAKLAADLRARITSSEALMLPLQGREVLALFQPQTRGEAHGAVLLLHDLNGHPDSPGPIQALRRRLPNAGWHTLSLQLPHSETRPLTIEQLDAMRPRIAAALAELEGRAAGDVVLIGHGAGAHAAIDYLRDNLAPSVRGLVVIGLEGDANEEPRLDAAAGLGRLNMPILDIYGGRDYPGVVAKAKRRYDMARRGNGEEMPVRPAYADVARDYNEKMALSLSYRQVRVPAADHRFSAQESNLVKRVRGWLKRHITDSPPP